MSPSCSPTSPARRRSASVLDPEDVRALQGELFELLNTEVERHGGMTEKFVGDAVWHSSAPRTHTRTMPSARCARRSLSATGSRCSRAGSRPSWRRRWAAHRGEHRPGRFRAGGGRKGRARRQRRRSERRRPAPAARRAGRDPRRRQDADPRRSAQSCSTAAAASQRRARRARSGRGSPRSRGASFAARARGLSAPLVGRDTELAVLTAVARSSAAPTGHHSSSRSSDRPEWGSRACSPSWSTGNGDVRLLKGRCLPYGDGITYWPLAEVAKSHAGVLETDSAEVALAEARDSRRRDCPPSMRRAVVEALTWTLGLSLPGAGAHGIRLDGRPDTALRRVGEIRRGTRSRPRHDPRRRGHPLGVGAAARPPRAPRRHTRQDVGSDRVPRAPGAARRAADVGGGEAERHGAEPAAARPSMMRGGSSRSCSAWIPSGTTPAVAFSTGRRATRSSWRRSCGMLIDQGALERRDGGWFATAQLAEIPLPDSVHGVIAARIDLLDAASREALRRCAVMGRIFWPAAVGVEEELVGSLARRGLVSEQPASVVAGMREFTFKHALTRTSRTRRCRGRNEGSCTGASRSGSSTWLRTGSRRWGRSRRITTSKPCGTATTTRISPPHAFALLLPPATLRSRALRCRRPRRCSAKRSSLHPTPVDEHAPSSGLVGRRRGRHATTRRSRCWTRRGCWRTTPAPSPSSPRPWRG